MSKPKSPKQKMAIIREVYDRILWDNRLDRRAFSLGFSGPNPLARFKYISEGTQRKSDRTRAAPLFPLWSALCALCGQKKPSVIQV